MFFDSWQDILRILIVGTCGYIGVVVLLRITGKRTLAKMNAFDFVVTVALGSILATLLLNPDVSLADGLAAFALLCALQYVVASLALRSDSFERLIKAEPSLLFYRGHPLPQMLKKERVTEEEAMAAVRESGIARLEDIGAVVLETDGSISVLTDPVAPEQGALKSVTAPQRAYTGPPQAS